MTETVMCEHKSVYVYKLDGGKYCMSDTVDETKSLYYSKEVYCGFDVDKEVKILMSKFGVDNVRGGSYSEDVISDDVKKFLEKEIEYAVRVGSNDSDDEEVTDDDEVVVIICERCGGFDHSITECEATFNTKPSFICMQPLEQGHLCTNVRSHLKKLCNQHRIVCRRCGNLDHLASDCRSAFNSVGLLLCMETYRDHLCCNTRAMGEGTCELHINNSYSSCRYLPKVTTTNLCSRCGECSHDVTSCVSFYHKDGSPICMSRTRRGALCKQRLQKGAVECDEHY